MTRFPFELSCCITCCNFGKAEFEIGYLCSQMARLSNQNIIQSIRNGDEGILLYVSGKYFQTARKWLRRHGCRDNDTPSVFSSVLVKVFREIQRNNISSNVDFELFFFNSLRDYLSYFRSAQNVNEIQNNYNEKEIIASCFSIVEESSRKILSERCVEKLSFEQIAARHEFSNPVIAQFEFNKAFAQFENISKARLNITSN